MMPHMDLGLCYRVVYSDGTSLQFRYVGRTPEGVPLVEAPPDSGVRQVLWEGDVKDFYEIDVPAEELERAEL